MIQVDKLRKGDTVVRAKPATNSFAFAEGKEYEVLFDVHGKPYILEDDGTKYDAGRLRANAQMWRHHVLGESVGKINMLSVESHLEDSKLVFEVTVLTDKKGKETIKHLVEKSKVEDEANKLDEEIANLEASLARLKAKRETIK